MMVAVSLQQLSFLFTDWRQCRSTDKPKIRRSSILHCCIMGFMDVEPTADLSYSDMSNHSVWD